MNHKTKTMIVAIIVTAIVFGFIIYKAVQMSKSKAKKPSKGGGGGSTPVEPNEEIKPEENFKG